MSTDNYRGLKFKQPMRGESIIEIPCEKSPTDFTLSFSLFNVQYCSHILQNFGTIGRKWKWSIRGGGEEEGEEEGEEDGTEEDGGGGTEFNGKFMYARSLESILYTV